MGLFGSGKEKQNAAQSDYYESISAWATQRDSLPRDDYGNIIDTDDTLGALNEECNEAEQGYVKSLSFWERLRRM